MNARTIVKAKKHKKLNREITIQQTSLNLSLNLKNKFNDETKNERSHNISRYVMTTIKHKEMKNQTELLIQQDSLKFTPGSFRYR